MSAHFGDVQRIVLRGTRWRAARHVMLSFADSSPLHFLNGLLRDDRPTAAAAARSTLQFSLGFTRRGLEGSCVPAHVMACFALKAPAYWTGAALRAASHLHMSGPNTPGRWDPAFAYTSLDAVLSIHSAADDRRLADALDSVVKMAQADRLACLPLPPAVALPAPEGVPQKDGVEPRGQWVHFGFRDGLSRIGIKGWTPASCWDRLTPSSRHEAGEFILGHRQDCGSDPWAAGPGLRVWPDKVRAFFHNGSFGVLQQIEQHVAAFDEFLESASRRTGLGIEEIKGKLCGRYPDGRPMAVPDCTDPMDDFDYGHDDKGMACPFGSHIRRMNPRLQLSDVAGRGRRVEPHLRSAHFSRARALLRRGMPYGPSASSPAAHDAERGLIGQFFCASIEDQFEHLVGEWAERVPLGSPDGGGARDPFIGSHEPDDGPFEVPGVPAGHLHGLRPFTRTVGAAYLFYPSLTTLRRMANADLWGAEDEDERP